MEQGHEPIQPDDDNPTSRPCNSQLGDSESDSIQFTSTSTEPTNSTKKGFSVYDLYKKAIKKLSKPPDLTPTVNFRDRMSAMISESL